MSSNLNTLNGNNENDSHLIERNLGVSAFPGILNWQHRIWICLNEFYKARVDEKISKPETNDVDYETEDLRLFELRNYTVAKAEHYYSNAQFSSAIKICQELTDELRVSKISAKAIHKPFLRNEK